MKYRLLSLEEFDGLKTEFINFLIVQGYDAQAWQQVKNDNPSMAAGLMALFSDFIFDNIVNKIKYIEYHDKSGIKLFKCNENDIHLIGIESKSENFVPDQLPVEIQSNPESYVVYVTSKTYAPDRSAEIFRMINSGGLVSNGEWFEYFHLYLNSK
jgi:hypothetical protein